MFSHLRGPKYVRYVAGMNENRGDGSYIYEFPLILDESGEVWYGGYSQGFYPSGTNSNPDNDSDGYEHMPEQAFEGNSENSHRKRRGTLPNNTKIVDLHCYGFPTAQNFACRTSDGKLMRTGYQGNNNTYMYDIMPYRYYTQTISSWGSNNYQTHWSSSPGD